MIRLTLAEEPQARLEIYNSLGQRVRTVISGILNPGRHEIGWDAKDAAGRSSGSDVYLYRLLADQRVLKTRMLQVR